MSRVRVYQTTKAVLKLLMSKEKMCKEQIRFVQERFERGIVNI